MSDQQTNLPEDSRSEPKHQGVTRREFIKSALGGFAFAALKPNEVAKDVLTRLSQINVPEESEDQELLELVTELTGLYFRYSTNISASDLPPEEKTLLNDTVALSLGGILMYTLNEQKFAANLLLHYLKGTGEVFRESQNFIEELNRDSTNIREIYISNTQTTSELIDNSEVNMFIEIFFRMRDAVNPLYFGDYSSSDSSNSNLEDVLNNSNRFFISKRMLAPTLYRTVGIGLGTFDLNAVFENEDGVYKIANAVVSDWYNFIPNEGNEEVSLVVSRRSLEEARQANPFLNRLISTFDLILNPVLERNLNEFGDIHILDRNLDMLRQFGSKDFQVSINLTTNLHPDFRVADDFGEHLIGINENVEIIPIFDARFPNHPDYQGWPETPYLPESE